MFWYHVLEECLIRRMLPKFITVKNPQQIKSSGNYNTTRSNELYLQLILYSSLACETRQTLAFFNWICAVLYCFRMNFYVFPYQTLSPARRTFVFLGSRCTRLLTLSNAHALRCEFSKWRTGQRGK